MSSNAHPEPAHGPVPANRGGGRCPAAKMAAMRQTFLDFFDAESPLVVRFLMRNGASMVDAEDAAQYMALQGWRKVQRDQWDQITYPPAWARRVALNYHRAQPAIGSISRSARTSTLRRRDPDMLS
jgi:Sigma-70 region 2